MCIRDSDKAMCGRGAFTEVDNTNPSTGGAVAAATTARATRRAVRKTESKAACHSASEFSSAVDAAKRSGRPSILIGVYRAGRTTFLPLKVSG